MPKLWLRIVAAYCMTGDWWKNNTDASFDGCGGCSEDPAGPSAGFDPDNVRQFSLRLQMISASRIRNHRTALKVRQQQSKLEEEA